MSSEEERIFAEHEESERRWMQENARLARQRAELALRQSADRDANGSTIFGLPSTSWSIADSQRGVSQVPTRPRGYFVEDSKFNGHEHSIYEPTISQRLWMEALARIRPPQNKASSQQSSTSEIAPNFSSQDIRERRPRDYGARWYI